MTKTIPMTTETVTPRYTIQECKDWVSMLDEARKLAKAHPEKYDAETIADLNARIKKWSDRLTELHLQTA